MTTADQAVLEAEAREAGPGEPTPEEEVRQRRAAVYVFARTQTRRVKRAVLFAGHKAREGLGLLGSGIDLLRPVARLVFLATLSLFGLFLALSVVATLLQVGFATVPALTYTMVISALVLLVSPLLSVLFHAAAPESVPATA